MLTELLQIAFGNFLSPMVLFFGLGVLAGWAKSDLAMPEAISKGLSLYLMLAIGFKGGVELASSGVNVTANNQLKPSEIRITQNRWPVYSAVLPGAKPIGANAIIPTSVPPKSGHLV